MATFKIRNEQLVKKYLEEVVTHINPDRSISGFTNIIFFNQYHYALTYQVKFFKDISYPQKSRIIRDSLLNSAVKQGGNLLSNFKDEIETQIQLFLRQTMLRFYLVIPTNIISTSIKKEHFNVLDNKILVRDYRWLEKRFDIKNAELQEEITDFSSPEHFDASKVFMIIEGYARNKYQFAEKAEDIYETFRSIINFIESYRRTPLIMWPRKPLSFIKESPLLLIFDENKKYLVLKFRTNVQPLDSINFEKADRDFHLVKQYEKIEKKINGLQDEGLRNAALLSFKLHNSGLDSYDQNWLTCFYLWQILEVLFLTKRSDNYKLIPGRVIAFLEHIEPYYDIIEYFMEKRHSMVHQAKFEIFSEADADTMKDMIEYLIWRFLARTSKIKTYKEYEIFLESIDFYLQNSDIHDLKLKDHLKLKKEILALFEKNRIFKNP